MSIRSKLTSIFLTIAAVPLLFVSALTYTNFKNSLEANRLTQLQDLSVFRANRIETYFAGLKGDIEIAKGFYNIQKNLPVMTRLAGRQKNPEFVAANKMLGEQLRQMQSVSDMTDIMLVSPDGKVAYANRSSHYGKDFTRGIDAERMAFEKGKHGIYLSDIYFDKAEDNRFEMLVAAPAAGFDGSFIGVIVFEVDMTPVYKLIQDVTGLGTTGEVLVGKKTDNHVEFLNPLRHDPKAALTRKAALGDQTSFPIQQAVQGKTGAGLAIDYRGKQVIAAWRYIPSMDWGLVAKIDTREAFADVTNLRNLVLLIVIIVFALSGIMAFSIAQSFSGPIQRLSEGAAIIGSGNLDHKLGTDQKDEIGQLSRSFDKMTHDLKTITASRDELDREITARKKTEESLLQTTDDLSRSNKDLEQFAYVASHDLQEPLRAVAGFMGLLKNKYLNTNTLDAEAQEYIGHSVKGAERMQSLINDLLDYSRVGTRGKKPELTEAKAALDEAVARLQASINESGAKISSGELPRVYVDEAQLSQLFQNLIGNAIKFRGEQSPQVRINADRLDAGWRFSVADNGIGIERQYAHKIFMIFQRLHSREKYPGTGIGLAVCKRIVERHNGKIWFESAPGRGTTFFFTIPHPK